MGEEIIVLDSFLVAAFIGTSVISLTIAASAWFFRREMRRSEERLAERLGRQIHDRIARLEQIQTDGAAKRVGDDLSDDELELTELVDEELSKQGDELPDHAAQVGGEPSIEENLLSMGRIIRAEKGKHRSEEQLAERLGRQIHNKGAGLEQIRTDGAAKQVRDELSEHELELADDDPSTEEILSSMRRAIRSENA